MRIFYTRSFCLTTMLTVFAGCSQLKASPAADSGFIAHPERMSQDENRPFHAVWRQEDLNANDYDSLYVAPVNIEYLFKMSDWRHINVMSQEEIELEARDLAWYFRHRLNEKLHEVGIVLVDQPHKRTVILEVAIVELVPTDVVRSAGGAVAGFIVPGGGLVSAGSGGYIAIEGKYTDAMTGQEIALFKDKEQAKLAPVDLAGLTAFRHAKNSIDDWVSQIVLIITLPEGSAVADSSPFRLSPW